MNGRGRPSMLRTVTPTKMSFVGHFEGFVANNGLQGLRPASLSATNALKWRTKSLPRSPLYPLSNTQYRYNFSVSRQSSG